MKIASIKIGRRDKEKLVIYTECGKCILARVDDAYMLKAGDEISSSRAEELEALYKSTLAKKSAAKTLARRSVSKNELSKKLLEKGFSEEESYDAVSWFEKRGFLDDEAYAEALVQYYTARGYGPLRIKKELFHRGIEREICEKILSLLPESTDEISRLILKKLHGEELTPEKKNKIVAFLMRRGFKYDEIKAAFANIRLDSEDFD